MAHQTFKFDKTDEGEVFCKWMHNRLIRRNKNVLGAELGPTGSGKSYRDLRKAELWYAYHFKEPFPTENICFGVATLMQRLSSGELRRGEVLIFEEAGANLGALDFQNNIVKTFTYILQSFRSMNIAIFFNLPYLSMLNKQARLLLHYSFESAGIDFQNKTNKCKPLFHQVNQGTGKIYKRYLRAKVNGRSKVIKRLNFQLPNKELCNSYEQKKFRFVNELSESFLKKLEDEKQKEIERLGRKELDEKQLEVYDLACEGLTQKEIGKRTGRTQSAVNSMLKTIKKYGYSIKIEENPKENQDNAFITE